MAATQQAPASLPFTDDTTVAVLRIDGMPRLVEKFGKRPTQLLVSRVHADVQALLPESAVTERDNGEIVVRLHRTVGSAAESALTEIGDTVARNDYAVRGVIVRVGLFAGYSDAAGIGEQGRLVQARMAAEQAIDHRDLRPRAWAPDPGEATRPSLLASRTTLQILLTLLLGLVPPFLLYAGADALGVDLTTAAYAVLVVVLLGTASALWAECCSAADPIVVPKEAGAPYPRASAVVAAYLPNETETVLATVQCLLAQDYPGDLQVVLAYNTPDRLPVEAELAALADADPRLTVLHVDGSTSKAQNVNAALAFVDGAFVGVFDADHQVSPDAFERAWRWLSNGYDVVQGHCAVRNGDESGVARIVAVEFEGIYAVSHPGRTQLHGFGIFGGSNGYWRTEVLHAVRLQSSMLTEDIDASIRALLNGRHVANDPELVSRELAPTTLPLLWKQRLRWSQGWHQASRRHLVTALRSPQLTLRQKAGMSFLLGWRETQPWIALQMVPLLAYQAVRGDHIAWVLPFGIVLTGLSMSSGPIQTLFAYRLALPELRARRSWWLRYLLVSLPYAEFRNAAARVAQLREVLGIRPWVVTARSSAGPAPTAEGLDLAELTIDRTTWEPIA